MKIGTSFRDHAVRRSRTYTTPGTYTLTLPARVSVVNVKLVGGGGGGGGGVGGVKDGTGRAINGSTGAVTRFGDYVSARGGLGGTGTTVTGSQAPVTPVGNGTEAVQFGILRAPGGTGTAGYLVKDEAANKLTLAVSGAGGGSAMGAGGGASSLKIIYDNATGGPRAAAAGDTLGSPASFGGGGYGAVLIADLDNGGNGGNPGATAVGVAGGGNGAETVIVEDLVVAPGSSITIVVGAGGVAGYAPVANAAGQGETTLFPSPGAGGLVMVTWEE